MINVMKASIAKTQRTTVTALGKLSRSKDIPASIWLLCALGSQPKAYSCRLGVQVLNEPSLAQLQHAHHLHSFPSSTLALAYDGPLLPPSPAISQASHLVDWADKQAPPLPSASNLLSQPAISCPKSLILQPAVLQPAWILLVHCNFKTSQCGRARAVHQVSKTPGPVAGPSWTLQALAAQLSIKLDRVLIRSTLFCIQIRQACFLECSGGGPEIPLVPTQQPECFIQPVFLARGCCKDSASFAAQKSRSAA
eukprot:gb/GFBE01007348.1/.p1 GENE.gb/GFBE01007348.1/~~gb/GFBE01007348.1/.p1  ORF type:complete len:252 (+),score=25.10 gb/GFBE01007348.1/:1-756(+)